MILQSSYNPRRAFQSFHESLKRWNVIVAHRRAGKTTACINHLIRWAALKQDGRYAFISPFYAQSKDIAWQILREYAQPFIELGATVNESELRVDFSNGSRIRLYGADNYDRLRGLGFDGVVLDEYADMDPRAFAEVIRPALSDRQGSCIWIGTPKGHNNFYDMYKRAQDDPDWFALELKASQTQLLPQSELDAAKHDLTKDQYNQEYECSFSAAIQGAYYGTEMREAEDDKRIQNVHYDKALEVHTAWDLGIGDSTSIWFAQFVSNEVRLIDFYEASGVGLDHYAKELKNKPYVYGQHILPHDVQVKELGTGKSRFEVLTSLGLLPTVCPKLSVDDGIQAVRAMLSRCYFDRKKCDRGIEALKQYRAAYDEKNKAFKVRPLHDWTSHAADAFRYLAVGFKAKKQPKELEIDTSWVA
tara:strand:- start:1574 stop:2824 length:1251 start_codon:yes stop_codon:yes gene_type:complete